MEEQLYFLGIKAIIQNKNGKILILKHSGGYWDFPGGRTNQDESISDCLLREVQEETGISKLQNISPRKMLLTKFKPQNKGLILWYHTCNIEEEENIILSNEHTEYLWATPEEAMEYTKIDWNLKA